VIYDLLFLLLLLLRQLLLFLDTLELALGVTEVEAHGEEDGEEDEGLVLAGDVSHAPQVHCAHAAFHRYSITDILV